MDTTAEEPKTIGPYCHNAGILSDHPLQHVIKKETLTEEPKPIGPYCHKADILSDHPLQHVIKKETLNNGCVIELFNYVSSPSTDISFKHLASAMETVFKRQSIPSSVRAAILRVKKQLTTLRKNSNKDEVVEFLERSFMPPVPGPKRKLQNNTPAEKLSKRDEPDYEVLRLWKDNSELRAKMNKLEEKLRASKKKVKKIQIALKRNQRSILLWKGKFDKKRKEHEKLKRTEVKQEGLVSRQVSKPVHNITVASLEYALTKLKEVKDENCHLQNKVEELVEMILDSDGPEKLLATFREDVSDDAELNVRQGQLGGVNNFDKWKKKLTSATKLKDLPMSSSDDSDIEHDKTCAVCDEDGELIECCHCPSVYHLECHELHFPRGRWKCADCQDPSKKAKKARQKRLAERRKANEVATKKTTEQTRSKKQKTAKTGGKSARKVESESEAEESSSEEEVASSEEKVTSSSSEESSDSEKETTSKSTRRAAKQTKKPSKKPAKQHAKTMKPEKTKKNPKKVVDFDSEAEESLSEEEEASSEEKATSSSSEESSDSEEETTSKPTRRAAKKTKTLYTLTKIQSLNEALMKIKK